MGNLKLLQYLAYLGFDSRGTTGYKSLSKRGTCT